MHRLCAIILASISLIPVLLPMGSRLLVCQHSSALRLVGQNAPCCSSEDCGDSDQDVLSPCCSQASLPCGEQDGKEARDKANCDCCLELARGSDDPPGLEIEPAFAIPDLRSERPRLLVASRPPLPRQPCALTPVFSGLSPPLRL